MESKINLDVMVTYLCPIHGSYQAPLGPSSASMSIPPCPSCTTSFVLPTTAAARKNLPIWTGVLMYFPLVWAEVAKVSVEGNKQHNPGEPLHWARGKSTDQMDSAFRHMLDHATGSPLDVDGNYHLAKAIWRLCAELQLYLEARARGEKP